jgi:serine/threonine-protein kinase
VTLGPGVTIGGSRVSQENLLDSPALDEGRFIPGQILAERYRIVALLGKGGMGEVYRADDLTLGQPVAMKFLPEAVAHDGAAQARFHREVRLARQVSHPNVCRVFDIGEAAGLPFLSMEYVDGEDLASLLKRIGHLPQDKAIDIARQICAGLAAAHEAGVLHRDLKPANLMLDRRGKIRITDFGLAGVAAIAEREVVAGTPAYMAPEQLTGQPATAQSDIYSLGLVLYELFTGKAAFDAATVAELVRQRESTTPKSPGQLVQDLDPLIERVVLRCLEAEPERRPHSALQVAAALPGGDPLAAALAAGETPSPEMVAAAGGEGVLQPRVAWGVFLASLLVISAIVALAPYSTDLGLAPPRKSRSALEVRAQEILERAGYADLGADRISWLERNYDFLLYTAKHFPGAAGRRELPRAEQGVLEYFFRQSPQALIPANPMFRIQALDPPNEVSGMAEVLLDSNGRLLAFLAVPPQVEEMPPPAAAAEPDWTPMLANTGLDPAGLKAMDPTWLPPVGFDRRFGWRGFYPEDRSTEILISAASYRGQPVYFQVIGPWSHPWRMPAPPQPMSKVVKDTTFLIASFAFLALAAFFARRNIRLGRGDRRGGFRISAFVFACYALSQLLLAHHVRDLSAEWQVFALTFGEALFAAGFMWLYYLACEPYVRRQWPELLISWTRLLAGKFRDPLIGRDLLVGVLVGSVTALALHFSNSLPTWFNLAGQTTIPPNPLSLGPAHDVVGVLLKFLLAGLLPPFSIVFALFLTRSLLRSYWASVLLTGLLVLISNLGGENFLLETPFAILTTAITMFVLLRFGMLALTVAVFTSGLLTYFPVTLDLSKWYATNSLLMFAVLVALLLYGLRTALGNRPLLPE